ncbi:MAG TPA: transcription antitermination factor NusB [Propionibacteriaceae bacterium]
MAHSSTRSKARKRALDILFEAELRDTDPVATLEERAADANPPVRDYTAELVRGVAAHTAEIDARISACLASGWTLPRMPRVDRNALRIAVYEIDYSHVPDAVAVAEAVQLVSELSTDESPAFVNGVLRAVTTSKAG